MARTRSDVITLANYEALFPPLPDCRYSRYRQSMRTIQAAQDDIAHKVAEARARNAAAISDGANAARQHDAAGIVDGYQRAAAAQAELEHLEREQHAAGEIWQRVNADRSEIERNDRAYRAWLEECDNIRQAARSVRMMHDAGLSYQENEAHRQRAFNGFVAEVVAGRT